MFTLFKETGEVRPPKKGEWFLNGDNTPCLTSQFFETYCANNNVTFCILTRITADTWEELKGKMKEGKNVSG